jgi:hypothetical protein
MSASDAAPLPRLGEVFFDVRGSSRSMRLSWYADTGVAVFSIWQGGMCTGTFRLPIGDLPRMIDLLQRGPLGEGAPTRGADEAGWGMAEGYAGQREQRRGGPRRPERDGRSDRPSYRGDDQAYRGDDQGYRGDDQGYRGDDQGYRGDEAGYRGDDAGYRGDEPAYRGEDLAETAAAGFGRDDLADRYGRDAGPEDLRGPEYGRRRSGYDQDERLAEPRGPGYDYPDYPDALGEPRRRGYERDAAFPADRAPDPGGPSTGWDAFSDGPYPGYETQPPPGEAQLGGRDPGEPPAGYGQERFVPPYVRAASDDYPYDIPGRGADLPTVERRAAYRGGPPADRSEAAGYPEPSWASGGYSDREQYRLAGAPADLPDLWTEHQSAVPYGEAGQPEPEPGGHSVGPFPADRIEGEVPDFRSRRSR